MIYLIVTGDMLEDEFPEGDLYVMSHVLHCFKGNEADTLLSKIYNRLPQGMFKKYYSMSSSIPYIHRCKYFKCAQLFF